MVLIGLETTLKDFSWSGGYLGRFGGYSVWSVGFGGSGCYLGDQGPITIVDITRFMKRTVAMLNLRPHKRTIVLIFPFSAISNYNHFE